MTEAILGELVEMLRAADAKDDDQFRDLLSRSIEVLGLSDKDIARQFGVSRPTVTRWRNGDNAPHPGMRKFVFSWLQQRANVLRRRAEQRTVPSSASGYGSEGAMALAARSRDR